MSPHQCILFDSDHEFCGMRALKYHMQVSVRSFLNYSVTSCSGTEKLRQSGVDYQLGHQFPPDKSERQGYQTSCTWVPTDIGNTNRLRLAAVKYQRQSSSLQYLRRLRHFRYATFAHSWFRKVHRRYIKQEHMTRQNMR